MSRSTRHSPPISSFTCLYSKDGERGVTLALARGRFDGTTLTEVRDIFVAEAWEAGGGPTSGGGTFGGRMLFGPDGLLYVTVGDRDVRVLTDDPTVRSRAQSLRSDTGKILRLRDDGSVPTDNPFVGRADALPEIFTYGHRNPYGLAFHPQSGALWECEFGPMGGDELNVLVAGRNYGWPLVSFGRNYSGIPVSDQPWWRPGIEMPAFTWNPVGESNQHSLLHRRGVCRLARQLDRERAGQQAASTPDAQSTRRHRGSAGTAAGTTRTSFS